MQAVVYPSWCYVIIALFCVIPLVFIFGVFILYSVKSRHMLFETCHNSWKSIWYWCKQEEEYELQDFTEVQRCYQSGEQVLLDRIDANFPELLSFDNIQGPLTNGHAYSGTIDMADRILRENNNIQRNTPTRHLSV